MNSSESTKGPVTVTREELYDLVWAHPMSHLAKRFGISDQGLAKICKRLDVPRPKQGHWNKLAAGKAVETIPLGASKAETDRTAIISPWPTEDNLDPRVREALEQARAGLPTVRINERMVQPHAILASWIADRERQVATRGRHYDHRTRRHSQQSPFSAPERRRLRILDGLIKALEAGGIAILKGERRELAASLGKEKIEFQLRIKLRQFKRPLTDNDPSWLRTGGKDYRLEFEETDAQIFEIDTWLPEGLRRMWQDTARMSLEAMANDIVATIVAAFPLLAAERERRAEQKQQQEIEEQRRREALERRKLEDNRLRRLVEHADRWREAKLARAFIDALRSRISDPDIVVDGRTLREWLEWADEVTERRDPMADPARVFQSIAQVRSWTYRN